MKKRTTSEAYQLLQDGSLALAEVEANGVRIDCEYLDRSVEKIRRKIDRIETKLKATEVYQIWEREFGGKTNLNSSDQLAHVMYDKLGFKPTRFTARTQKAKTDERAMEVIDHPFAKEWIKWNKHSNVTLSKLLEIKNEIVDGYIHPMYGVHTAISFRGSCARPNFQSLPIRNPSIAKVIRPCFIPRGKDRCIVEVDLNQNEVRCNGAINQDPVLISYILDPDKDMHRDSAAEIYKTTPDQVGKQMRYAGKNMMVFPQFYGSYYIDCAQNLWEYAVRGNLTLNDGTSVIEHLAKKGIKRLGDGDPKKEPASDTFEYVVKKAEQRLWNDRFTVYRDWKRNWWKDYLKTGGFWLPTGFYIEGIFKRNETTNFPAQGAGFHILLKCIIKVVEWLRKSRMRSLLIGQIHDSLVMDCLVSEVEKVLEKIQYILEVWLPEQWNWLIVPPKIEVEVSPPGQSWHQKAPWIYENGKWGPK